nr:hypothetical protein [Pandoravirus massiliensis]
MPASLSLSLSPIHAAKRGAPAPRPCLYRNQHLCRQEHSGHTTALCMMQVFRCTFFCMRKESNVSDKPHDSFLFFFGLLFLLTDEKVMRRGDVNQAVASLSAMRPLALKKS